MDPALLCSAWVLSRYLLGAAPNTRHPLHSTDIGYCTLTLKPAGAAAEATWHESVVQIAGQLIVAEYIIMTADCWGKSFESVATSKL